LFLRDISLCPRSVVARRRSLRAWSAGYETGHRSRKAARLERRIRDRPPLPERCFPGATLSGRWPPRDRHPRSTAAGSDRIGRLMGAQASSFRVEHLGRWLLPPWRLMRDTMRRKRACFTLRRGDTPAHRPSNVRLGEQYPTRSSWSWLLPPWRAIGATRRDAGPPVAARRPAPGRHMFAMENRPTPEAPNVIQGQPFSRLGRQNVSTSEHADGSSVGRLPAVDTWRVTWATAPGSPAHWRS
jgi:hypothetical protein